MKYIQNLVVAICVTTLVACGGAEDRKAVYLAKAKESMEADNLDKARIELMNVLQIDPKDSNAYYQLGRVYEKQQEYRKAFSNYLKAEELDPDLLINQARLGRLYLILANDEEKARKAVDTILSKDEKHPEGLLLKAALLLKNNKKQEALEIAENILSLDPGNSDTASFIASLYIKDKEYKKAVGVLEKALSSNSDDNQMNDMLAISLTTLKEYDKAEVIFNNFLKKYPEDRKSYTRLAALHNKAGDESKAIDVLRRSVLSDPKDVDRHLDLVRYIQKAKGSDSAISELEKAVDNNLDLGRLRIALAELYYLSGDTKSAIKVYSTAIEDFSDELTGIESRIALATLYLKNNETEEANKIVNEALSVSPNDPNIHYLNALIATKQKDYEKAMISLRIVNKELPDKIEAYILLADIYRSENNKEQVRVTLANAYHNNKSNIDALLKLSKYYLPVDLGEAEKIIDDITVLDEYNYDALSMKAAIYNNNKPEEAHPIAKKLIDLYPDRPNGYLQIMPYLLKKGEKDEAISILEAGYLTVEDNKKILSYLIAFLVDKKEYNKAIDIIKAELESTPDDPELNLHLASIYLKKDAVAAEDILKKLTRTNPGLELPYLMLSKMYQDFGDVAASKSILTLGYTNNPSSYKIALILATLYERNGEYDEAISIYKSMFNLHPDNLVVVNNLASMLSDHSTDGHDLLRELVAKLEKSETPIFLDTVGWAYYRLSDYSKAITYLTIVNEKSPDVNIFNYHLGMAYKMSGDLVKAKLYLEKSLSENKDFKERDIAEEALRDIDSRKN